MSKMADVVRQPGWAIFYDVRADSTVGAKYQEGHLRHNGARVTAFHTRRIHT